MNLTNRLCVFILFSIIKNILKNNISNMYDLLFFDYENNTFITARLVQKREIEYSYNYANNEYSRGWDYEGIYEYTLNGETKNKRILFIGLPDDEIRLYLKKENGSKVFSNTEYENKKWFVIPLIALATIVTLIWVVVMMEMIS